MPARQEKDEGGVAGVGGESSAAQERSRPTIDLLGDEEGQGTETGERGADLGAQMDRAFGGLG